MTKKRAADVRPQGRLRSIIISFVQWLNRLFRHRPTKTSKLSVTCLGERNSLGTGEFPSQSASNIEMFPFDDVIMIFPFNTDQMRFRRHVYLEPCVPL